MHYFEYSLYLLDTLPALVGITDTTTVCPDCETTRIAISGITSVCAARLTSPAPAASYQWIVDVSLTVALTVPVHS